MFEYIRLKQNARIFGRINIFVNKYSNIFEYPNIRYTLICVLAHLHFGDICVLVTLAFSLHLRFGDICVLVKFHFYRNLCFVKNSVLPKSTFLLSFAKLSQV